MNFTIHLCNASLNAKVRAFNSFVQSSKAYFIFLSLEDASSWLEKTNTGSLRKVGRRTRRFRRHRLGSRELAGALHLAQGYLGPSQVLRPILWAYSGLLAAGISSPPGPALTCCSLAWDRPWGISLPMWFPQTQGGQKTLPAWLLQCLYLDGE